MRRTSLSLLAAAPVLTLLASCGDEVLPSVDPVVRDSTGVRIVEYHGQPPDTEGFVFATEPDFRHGHREGDHLFQSIIAGVLRPDGGAIVADGGTREVLAFSSEGAFESTLARAGEGPGEIGNVRSVHLLGQDTVIIEDDGNARFTVLHSGEVLRTVSTARSLDLSMGLGIDGVDERGDLLMSTRGFYPPDSPGWLQGTLVRFDLETSVADSIGEYDFVWFKPDGELENPFSPIGTVAASDGRFIVGRSDVPELRWLSAQGQPGQLVRWDAPPILPTEADLRAYRARFRENLERMSPNMSARNREVMLEEGLDRISTALDEPMPIFGSILGNGTGGVWLGDYVPGGTTVPPPRYQVVRSDGTWMGSVTVPDGFRILDIEPGRVLGVVTDDLGVESIAVYSVR